MRALLVAALALGLAWVDAEAMEAIDAVSELQLLSKGEQPPRRFANASYRLAVFSYQDPDAVGLADALATLASHQLLTHSRVSSIAVLRFVGQLTPRPGEELGYFDKVQLLSRAQEPTVALWGMVRRDGDSVVVESYLQIPDSTLAEAFQARLKLPAAMGGATLQANLAPDRLLVQRLRLPLAAVREVVAAARAVNELREAPEPGAAIRAKVPLQTALYLVARDGQWVHLRAAGNADLDGWVPASGHCTDVCEPLLKAPGFVSNLLRFMRHRRAPPKDDGLAADARQLRDQLLAMEALAEAPPDVAHEEALWLLKEWLPVAGQAAAEAPPLGAIGANLRLLARLTGALREARRTLPRDDSDAYERIQLPPDTVRAAAFEAADATLVDPWNADLLHNLQVLYEALGDGERAALARRLLARAEEGRREGW